MSCPLLLSIPCAARGIRCIYNKTCNIGLNEIIHTNKKYKCRIVSDERYKLNIIIIITFITEINHIRVCVCTQRDRLYPSPIK
jgi:hypothetical protein